MKLFLYWVAIVIGIRWVETLYRLWSISQGVTEGLKSYVRNAIFRIDKGNLTMKKVGVLIGLVLLVVVLSLMHVLVDSRTATAQQSGYKLCSVVDSGNWRDSFRVSSGWSAGTCRDFMISTKATSYQLGCIFDDDFSWGEGGLSRPRPNCGW